MTFIDTVCRPPQRSKTGSLESNKFIAPFMVHPNITSGRSPYFSGRRLPFADLDPRDFENFVAACFGCIEDAQGIEILGMPTGSSDSGFDISGRDLLTSRIVCIQCKRQKKKLGIPQVAEELAKVAGNSKLEGSDVGQHRFICTGGITSDLIDLLRGDRTTLALEASTRLANASDGELKALRDCLTERGEDPQGVVQAYVHGLNKLLVWDLDNFDVALSARWSQVLDVVARYFSITNVVREHPRAFFDRQAYADRVRDVNAVLRPRLANARLPIGMTAPTSATALRPKVKDGQFDDITGLSKLNEGELIVLIGDGGVGKTTVLELIRAEVLKNQFDSAFAVVIPLANYTPGSLDNLVQDELGVDFGNWRSLPDRILLLFDGLNECPAQFLVNFLDELRIVLSRRLAACIVSTREAIRHRSIPLPIVPLKCLRVEHITPIAVRRIAQSRFAPFEASTFEGAYIQLANRAHAPHLWTPFSLEVAVAYWKLCSALPTTLGEMIEKLVQSRCENEANSPTHVVGASVVLALAGALAFVNLIKNSRIECAEIEAGKWIRDAKLLCADALGVVDMPELEVIELLKRHEFLRLSSTGSYSFGHQLLVGALAAKHLANNWRMHLASAEEPLADDAWIFAARFISEEELPEFLEEMLKADLMLGARVAREVKSQYQELVEEFLLRCVDSTSPEPVQVRGLFALSILATPNAISKLRMISREPDRDNSYHAKQALAAAGDRQLLRALVPSIEIMRAGPGEMSGGDLGIWERAPYSARLEVAREWLEKCTPGRTVRESLSLIAFERDLNDLKLVERQLVAGIHMSQWSHVLHAMHRLDRARANAVFEQTLSSADSLQDRTRLLQIAADIGVQFDVQLAFECARAELSGDEQDSMIEYELGQLIQKVIVPAELPPSLMDYVEAELKKGSSDNRTKRLWSVAAAFPNRTIADVAEARLAAWSDDLGQVCNYFLKQPLTAGARKVSILGICERGLSRQETWHTWHTYRALDLVGNLGFTTSIAAILVEMVEQITRIRIAVEAKDLSSLSSGDRGVIAAVNTEHLEIHIERLAAGLIPSVASAKLQVSEDVRLAFMYFDVSAFGGIDDDYPKLLLGLDAEVIDGVLRGLSERSVRRSSLCTACECGVTETRINLLAQELSENAEFPSVLNQLAQAIDACWCSAVCQMVMDTTARIPRWSHTQFFWDFADVVANRLEPHDREHIDAALQIAKTPFSRKVLEFWNVRATRARIGIGMLVPQAPDTR